MTETKVSLDRSSLKTPRAAAIAGILFAVLFGASMILIDTSIPTGTASDSAMLETHSGWTTIALFLLPFAGIAFLWFIGVVRSLLGELEDRLFATVFLGGGFIFLATTLVYAGLAGALNLVYIQAPGALAGTGVALYIRLAMYQIGNFSFRMAGLFMLPLASIWRKTGLMPRILSLLTIPLALLLMIYPDYSIWVNLIFPAWALVVSVYILIRKPASSVPKATGEVPG